MYLQYNPDKDRERQIRECVDRLNRRVTDIFDSTEDVRYQIDPNGQGVRVGIRSIRARQMLEVVLPAAVFRGFVAHDVDYEDNGMVWARFGF